ncbi:MAG: UDP-N-acetylglucosamine 1-carboxyvinyltransferase [Erysipelotrichaceae bacterium]|nr:UDP-N-acetylglucosamine 1-carboxyvinyltransferase [Erysipelotrichaceae bacterium]MBR2600070.1 UDP-N-acetylglucosamine 1-carboxyvinyltransferase [Erysipelotrichaceae bacterium]MBR2791107.1 UDP-N-acetylglucosamine 1-carboxyvinyltransferase [Erysipelotrichaceae bacterium]MBR3352276.1 UDP-N-acetylglucosamine 1-carboxyvinyltransferase [Erysipelotrichaceae bacterium]
MEEVIRIEGGHTLNGTIRVSGAKNATVALIPASVLATKPVRLVGIPDISDVGSLKKCLEYLDIEVQSTIEGEIYIDPSHMTNKPLDIEAVSKLRASYYFMGALLGKYHKVVIKNPGGCNLGPRPINLHIKGFEALGADVDYNQETNTYTIVAEKLRGNKIYLDIASVGATINIIMAAVYAEGRTIIENAAREPEIIDVITLLNKMGASIKGAGTNIITIDGVKELGGCFHEIIPDRIEAGTFMILAAAMADHVTLENVIPYHLDALMSKLKEAGVHIDAKIDYVDIYRSDKLKAVDIKTAPYPGFATDLQAPLTSLLTQATGISTVTETIYPERFKHCEQLNRMGANTSVTFPRATIIGKTPLVGTDVWATDLRCGSGLVVAGLLAEGITTIHDIFHIDRGYENLDGKLKDIGAKIWRETID